MSSAAISTVVETAPSIRGKTPWLRLAVLTVLLIAINAAVADGLFQALYRSGFHPRVLLPAMLFAGDWLGFVPVLLGLWLTWGGGSFPRRMILVLLTAAVGIAVPLSFHDDPHAAFEEFIGSLLIFWVVIFAIHALLVPLRGYLGWEFSFAPTSSDAARPKTMRWSLLHIASWTAFAAFPLAFARLLAGTGYWWRPPRVAHGPSPLIDFGLPLLIAVAVIVATYFPRLPLLVRLGLVPLIFSIVYALLETFRPPVVGFTPAWNLYSAGGMTAAALVNLSLIRLFGVRLHRPSRLAVPS